MATLRKGFYIELLNQRTNRVVFSAATDECSKDTFAGLWSQIGNDLYAGVMGQNEDAARSHYEIRVSPLC